MGRKVYHVWTNGNDFQATHTSFKKAKDKAVEIFLKHPAGNVRTVVSSYDLETHEHLDVWFSSFLKDGLNFKYGGVI